ncbi:hypothetical protein [Streptomyces sp. NPDC047061]|uniref:hypothetical protein n=1 Tax=Streptomyces sp. NPDC047061 TaxID=3154605 RepID=UPI0033EA6AF9
MPTEVEELEYVFRQKKGLAESRKSALAILSFVPQKLRDQNQTKAADDLMDAMDCLAYLDDARLSMNGPFSNDPNYVFLNSREQSLQAVVNGHLAADGGPRRKTLLDGAKSLFRKSAATIDGLCVREQAAFEKLVSQPDPPAAVGQPSQAMSANLARFAEEYRLMGEQFRRFLADYERPDSGKQEEVLDRHGLKRNDLATMRQFPHVYGLSQNDLDRLGAAGAERRRANGVRTARKRTEQKGNANLPSGEVPVNPMVDGARRYLPQEAAGPASPSASASIPAQAPGPNAAGNRRGKG